MKKILMLVALVAFLGSTVSASIAVITNSDQIVVVDNDKDKDKKKAEKKDCCKDGKLCDDCKAKKAEKASCSDKKADCAVKSSCCAPKKASSSCCSSKKAEPNK